MNSITFECEVITPMFLSGADGQTPELRPPSIKGALRFWWRAMNGHLPLRDEKDKKTGKVTKGLKTIEGEIFGSTSRRSKLVIRTESIRNLDTMRASPVPHKPRPFFKNALAEGNRFKVILSLVKNPIMNLEQLEALFILVCTLGGFGGRVRRGFGTVQILRRNAVSFQSPKDIEGIYTMIRKCFSNPSVTFPKTTVDGDNDCINIQFGKSNPYPYIKQIQIGRPQNNLLLKIGQTTHDYKLQKGLNKNRNYDASLGHAFKGRFASPIYVSTLKKGNLLIPIITTLNTVPDTYNRGRESLSLQKDFKKEIL